MIEMMIDNEFIIADNSKFSPYIRVYIVATPETGAKARIANVCRISKLNGKKKYNNAEIPAATT